MTGLQKLVERSCIWFYFDWKYSSETTCHWVDEFQMHHIKAIGLCIFFFSRAMLQERVTLH